MATAERRRREREAREGLILDAAERLVVDRGYLGMNMDLLAEAVEYSKGTVYQHFTSKEDVLCALAERMASERVRLFERAAAFRGRSRERMTAVGVSLDLFGVLYPEHFRLEQLVTADLIREKTSERRLESLMGREAACLGVVAGVVRDAVAAGDLELPEDFPPEGVVAGLWMTTYGGLAFLTGKPETKHMGLPPLHDVLLRTQMAILDGHGWRPLSHDYDYYATRRRVMEEVFPDEARRARFL